VWAALTDPQALAQWLMPNNFAPELGRKFQFRVDPMLKFSGVIDCEVVELEAPTPRDMRGKMVWSWTARFATGKPSPTMRVQWELEPHEGGTRLTLTQTGLDKLPMILRLMMTFGWGTMMKRWLPKVVAAFEPRSGGGWVYHKIEKAPNRGHHRMKTVPDEFFK
jgi:uncharacterized protein YndB with AHSA1/START domain